MGDVSISQLQTFLECDNHFKRELCNIRGDIKSHLSTFVVADFSGSDASEAASGEGRGDVVSDNTRNVMLFELFSDTLYKLALSGISTSTTTLQVGWQYDKNYFLTVDTFIRLLTHFGFDSVCTAGDIRLILWTYSHENHHRKRQTRQSQSSLLNFVNISDMNRQDDSKIICWLNFLTWLHWNDSEPYAAISHRLVARAVLLWNNDISSNSQRLTLQWGAPADIPYGTAISDLQLNACAETSKISGVSSLSSIEGTYRYTPKKTVVLNVTRLIPTVCWDEVQCIVCGDELGDVHLNAYCLEALSGTFFYSKTFGHVFQDPGTYEVMCTFIPDNSNYAKVTKTNMITVVPPDTGKKEALIEWDTIEGGGIEEIRVGEELTERHLRARVLDEGAEGSFYYSRSHSHTFLRPGEFEVTATFVPHERSSKFLRKSSKSVIIRVLEPKIQTYIVWDEPTDLIFGMTLTEKQLACYALDSIHNEPIEGRYEFSHQEGDVLDAGTHILSVTFYPRSFDVYEIAERSVPVTVQKAAPRLIWEEPLKREIAINEELDDTILTAYCRDDHIEGTVIYKYSFGHAFTKPGEVILEATFMPRDQGNYTAATRVMPIRVLNAKPLEARIFAESYISIEYGHELLPAMLNCRLVVDQQSHAAAGMDDADDSVQGVFTYSPSLEDISQQAGDYIVVVNYVPNEQRCLRLNILDTAKVEIHISKAEPLIDWDSSLSSIFVGQPLTADHHLCAKCLSENLTGQFFYSKDIGTSFTAAGTYEITATFVPSDPFDSNFKKVRRTATIVVHDGHEDYELVWNEPSPIDYGSPLGDMQLNPAILNKYAAVNGDNGVRNGDYTFDPTAGTVLPVGRHTLTVTFVPSICGIDSGEVIPVVIPIVKSIRITVNKATPIICWPEHLGTVSAGTTVSDKDVFRAYMQFSDHCETDVFRPTKHPTGKLLYSIPDNHIFHQEGETEIIVSFIPDADCSDSYQATTKSSFLTVAARVDTTLKIHWNFPNHSNIVYGTPFLPTSDQVEVTSSVSSTSALSSTPKEDVIVACREIEFEPPLGTILPVGHHKVSVKVHPRDSETYQTTTKVISLTVVKATPTIDWPEIAESMVVGEVLTSSHLCARCVQAELGQLQGTLFYTHSVGQTFSMAGLYRMTVNFVPTPPYDSNYQSTAQKSIYVTVNDVREQVEEPIQLIWPHPLPITFGTPLSHIQCNARAVYTSSREYASGVFNYSYEVGTFLAAGSYDVTVTFRSSDFVTYPNMLSRSVNLVVNKAHPQLKWLPSLSPLIAGHPLALEHVRIEVKDEVSGHFLYEPSLGHMFSEGGIHTINGFILPRSSVRNELSPE
jgi:hypothetical protein